MRHDFPTTCNTKHRTGFIQTGLVQSVVLLLALNMVTSSHAFYREVVKQEKYIKTGTVNFSITAYRNVPRLVFVTAGSSTSKDLYTVPVLFIKKQNKIRLLEFNKYRGYSWNYVTINHNTGTIWAILDYGVEGPGWVLEFLSSSDGGSSWRRECTLKKFYYYAHVSRFSLDDRGNGELVLRLGDYGSSHKQGYYRYTTTDGCKTWSKPEVIPDSYTPATLKHDSNIKKYLE